MDASILEVRKAQRSLARERERVEWEEPRLIKAIQAEARKAGSGKMVKVMARDLVRKRNQRVKLMQFESQMGQVETSMRTMQSMQKMAEAMKNAATAVAQANKRLKMPELSKVVAGFQRQMDTMGIHMDTMDEAMSDANDDEEEETEEVVNQVLDEIGIDVAAIMNSSGTVPAGSMSSKPSARTNEDAELRARLSALKDP